MRSYKQYFKQFVDTGWSAWVCAHFHSKCVDLLWLSLSLCGHAQARANNLSKTRRLFSRTSVLKKALPVALTGKGWSYFSWTEVSNQVTSNCINTLHKCLHVCMHRPEQTIYPRQEVFFQKLLFWKRRSLCYTGRKNLQPSYFSRTELSNQVICINTLHECLCVCMHRPKQTIYPSLFSKTCLEKKALPLLHWQEKATAIAVLLDRNSVIK